MSLSTLFDGISKEGKIDLLEMLEMLEYVWKEETIRLGTAANPASAVVCGRALQEISAMKIDLKALPKVPYKIEQADKSWKQKKIGRLEAKVIEIHITKGGKTEVISAKSLRDGYINFVRNAVCNNDALLTVALLSPTKFGVAQSEVGFRSPVAIQSNSLMAHLETNFSADAIFKKMIHWRGLMGCKPADVNIHI